MNGKMIAGIILTMFLIATLFSAVSVISTRAETMSASAGGMSASAGGMSASDGTIYVGVVGPEGSIQWNGMWEGAQLAAAEINNTGGIKIGGTFYQIQLVDIDEHSVPSPDPTAAVAELQAKLAAYPSMQFLIGGFAAECVAPMEDALVPYFVTNHRPIWIIAGAAEDSLISCVQSDYNDYKFMFRITLNSTVMVETLATFIKQTAAAKLATLYYGNASRPVPTYIIAENLAWCDSMVTFLQQYGAAFGMNIVGVSRPSPTATDFTPDIEAAEASGAKLVIETFSGVDGANFIKQVGALKPYFMCIGINAESQQQEFYASVGGACEYETILALSGTTTPLSAGAVAFYDETLSRFGHAPIYTSYDAYDAIYTLKEAIERAGTTNSSAVIPELEKTNRMSILGKFKFTGPNPNLNSTNYPYLARNPTMMGTLHDAFCNEIGLTWTQGYVRPLVCQWWQSPSTGKATLVVVWPRDQVYSRKWRIPTWIYPLADTDINLDGKVNAIDLALLASAYGARAGGPGWNPDCDIDGNGIVNMMDVAIFARDYGKSASPSSVGMVGASVQTASPVPAVSQTDSNAMVYLDSPTINGTAIGVKKTVTVYLMISGAVNVTSWDVGIAFNSTLLNCTAVNLGTFLQIQGATLFDRYGTINNKLGIITDAGRCVLGNYSASGDGTLAEITFKVMAGGVSDLHIRNATVSDIWGAENFAMAPFNIIDTYTVTHSAAQTSFTVSNSTGVGELVYGSGNYTGSGFYGYAFSHPAEQLSFNVTGPFPGWSNVTIPKKLLNVSTLDQVLVMIDGEPLMTYQRTVSQNQSAYFVYFNYTAGIHNISILKRPPVYNINRNLYYAKIQEAIDANETKCNDTILAYAGTHYENVVVNKSVSVIGEHNTTIDGSHTGTVIKVTANNVSISGFTIQHSGNPECGILVDGSNGSKISNNTMTGNYIGICLSNSSDNTLTNNTMSGNTYNFGLYGNEASHFNNTIGVTNTVDGKPVYYVKNVSNKVYNSSCNAGTFYLINCKNVTVRSLNLTKNVNGIFLWNTTKSKIQNVTSSYNLNGIYLQNSNKNTIYHNSFIENTIQANVTESYNNTWDDGYPSGGNYWSDYSLRPPFVVDEFKEANQSVQGNDGIIDDPKVIDPKNRDNYPLVSPLTPSVYNLNTHMGYTRIQAAINSAGPGDTIFVRNGTYRENLNINKSNLTLIGIIGLTVINGTGTVVTITADNVTFRGFTIQGSSSTSGILVYQHKNVFIDENIVTKNEYGIYLNDSEGCSISGNTINNNTEGIWLEFSGSNIISRNTIKYNSPGIVLDHSSLNDIHRNNVTYNDPGIELWQSNYNKIYHNNFINNTPQVQISMLSNNTWDDGYPSGGNYWSDYNNPYAGEIDNSGIWNISYPITNDNPDHYPLMGPWTPQHKIVANIALSKTVIGRGYSLFIAVTVENQGDYTEKFNITTYYSSTSITSYTITLTSGSSPLITFTWNTTGVPYGNYTLRTYATPFPGHTNITGTYTDGWVVVTIPGDINGDGYVGARDLGILGAAYGSYLGSPNYNPNADIDNEGYVGPRNLGILGANYGKYC